MRLRLNRVESDLETPAGETEEGVVGRISLRELVNVLGEEKIMGDVASECMWIIMIK